VKSQGCGKHPNAKGRGPNICHRLWDQNKDVTWAIIDDKEAATEYSVEEGDTDEYYHKSVDDVVVELKANGQDRATAEKAALAAVEREFFRRFYLPGKDLLIEEQVMNGNFEFKVAVQQFETEWKCKMQRRRQVRSDPAGLLQIYEPVKLPNPVLDQLDLKARGKVSKKEKKRGSHYNRGGKNSVDSRGELQLIADQMRIESGSELRWHFWVLSTSSFSFGCYLDSFV
jgi:hypothetical protein